MPLLPRWSCLAAVAVVVVVQLVVAVREDAPMPPTSSSPPNDDGRTRLADGSAGGAAPTALFREKIAHIMATRTPVPESRGNYRGTYDIDGRPSGFGILELNNGDVYTGQFAAGAFQGVGNYSWVRDRESYFGGFVDNRMEGNGTYRWHRDNITYRGSFRAGLRHGQGRMSFPDGSVLQGAFAFGALVNNQATMHFPEISAIASPARVYEGEVQHSKPHGRGVMMWPNKTYSGLFVEGLMEDANGTMVWTTEGRSYSGPFHADAAHGHGVMRWSDGSVYEGEFDNGEQTGSGAQFWAKEQLLYVGTFVNGVPEGKGTMFAAAAAGGGGQRHGEAARLLRRLMEQLNVTLPAFCREHGSPQPQRATYHGEYRNGKQHGVGYMWLDSGDTYNGTFALHEMHGQGTYNFSAPHGPVYVGQLRHNKFEGHGRMEYRGEYAGFIYEGDFLNNQYHGRGSQQMGTPASRYVGEFREGLKSGRGELWRDDGGAKYVGEFENDVEHGVGREYDAGSDELVREGRWKNGVFEAVVRELD